MKSVVICIVAIAMLSGCAGFKTIREAEDFLAAEKAKNIKPVIKLHKSGYTTPMDSAGKWVTAAIAAGPAAIGVAPLAVLGGAIGTQTGLMIAGKETRYEDLWYLAGAEIQYGRMVPYMKSSWDESGNKIYRKHAVDYALENVGPPDAPCEVAKYVGSWLNNKGKNRFKKTTDYASDKKERRGILMTNRISFTIFYKTVKPTESDKTPSYCTKELAEKHFSAVLKYMEEL